MFSIVDVLLINKIDAIRRTIESSKVSLNGQEQSVTASFGISYFPLNGTDLNELISKADHLLYEAKRSGKNRVLSGNIFKM